MALMLDVIIHDNNPAGTAALHLYLGGRRPVSGRT
jgi:hypothetical protein